MTVDQRDASAAALVDWIRQHAPNNISHAEYRERLLAGTAVAATKNFRPSLLIEMRGGLFGWTVSIEIENQEVMDHIRQDWTGFVDRVFPPAPPGNLIDP